MEIMAAVAAGLAVVFLGWGWPDARRIDAGTQGGGPRGGEQARWQVWMRGRSEAPPLKVRALAGGFIVMVAWMMLPRAVGLALGMAGGLVITVGWGWLEPSSVRQDRDRQRVQLPAALDLMAAALAAGVAPRVAAARVASVSSEPTRSALTLVRSETDVGRSDAQAWSLLGSTPRWEAVWGRVSRDLARSARNGVAVQEVLRQHARQARSDQHAAAERRARAVGVNSVLPLMVCFLPAFLAVGVAPIVLGLAMKYF